MDILAIGNSFSYDATRYLHQIARGAGCEINTANVHIGGCSLWRHYINSEENEKKYGLQYNGMDTMFYVSLKEALENREWDIIVMQQVSVQSVDYDTYQPYLDNLTAYVRKYQPRAKIYIHQTWEYGKEHIWLKDKLGYDEPSQMLDDIKEAYKKAATAVGAEKIIPSGELIGMIARKGIKIHRDNQHVTLGLGRFALGLLWYRVLSGKSVADITFSDFDEAVKEEDIQFVKECIEKLING